MVNPIDHSIHRATGEHPYPPEMMAHTEADRQAQREAGRKLQEELRALSGCSGRTYTVAPGYYRIEKGSLELSGIDRVRIIGNRDVHIIMETFATALQVEGAKDCRIGGLSIDYDPVPGFQGTVERYHPEKDELFVSIDGDYRDFFFKVLPAFRRSRIWFFEAEANENPVPFSSNHGMLDAVEQVGGNLFRLTISKIAQGPFLQVYTPDIHVGDKFAVPVVGGNVAVRITDTENCSFEDITVFSSPAFSFCETFGKGNNRYTRIRLIRRPDTDRLFVSASDGFHSIGVEHGATIEDSEFSYTTDDLFNAHNFLGFVLDKEKDRSCLLVFPCHQDLERGSRIHIYDFETTEIKGTGTIAAAERLNTAEWRTRGADFRQELIDHYKAGAFRSFDDPSVYRVTFDGPVELEKYDGLCPTSFAQEGLTIRNSYFHDGMVRGILLRGNRATIENNIIVNTNWSGILLETCFYWLEGPFVRDVVIRNNYFGNTNLSSEGLIYFSSVYLGLNMWGDHEMPKRTDLFRNILVTGNIFENLNGAAFYARNADGVAFVGNRILSSNPHPEKQGRMPDVIVGQDKALLEFQCCRGIRIDRNEFGSWQSRYCRSLLKTGNQNERLF